MDFRFRVRAQAIFFVMMMVERHAAAQMSAKRERQRAGLSAANVGASMDLNVGSKLKAAFHPYVNNLCFVLNLVLFLSVPP